MTYRDPKTGRWAVPNAFNPQREYPGSYGALQAKAKPAATYVFVYGTLKKGYSNHARLLTQARFVGDARTADKFDMVNWGAPMIFRDGRHPVRGEVYEVDAKTLQSLDYLEHYTGNPDTSMYDRIETTVHVAEPKGETTYQALVYVSPGRLHNLRTRTGIVQPDKDGLLTWGHAIYRGFNFADEQEG